MPQKPETQRAEVGKDHPNVTIGMPVYNSVHSIEQALAGLAAQTYPHYRLVISDNASTDGTTEILKAWAAKDERITLYRQETNIGHTQNFRYVLDQADTEYFFWHASDDWVDPKYVEELLRVMTTQTRCAFVSPKIVHVKVDGSYVEEIPFPDLDSVSRLARTKQLLAQSWGHRIYGLFRTDALRSAKALTEEFGYVFGWDAIAQLPFMLNDRMCGTNQAVLYYRLNEGFSLKLYKPQTRAKMLRFWGRYLRSHLGAWHGSELTLFDKLRVFPSLLLHSIESLRLRPGKALFKMIKRPVRRVFKAVVLGPIRAVINRK